MLQNDIEPEGMMAIAKALKSHHCHDLGRNYGGPDGAKAIAEALNSPHCKLTKLDLYAMMLEKTVSPICPMHSQVPTVR